MSKLKEQFKLGQAFGYFLRVFGKRDTNAPDSFNLRMMHGINRISILMFLFALCVMLYRYFTR
jgi:hypothetical protein